MTHSSLPNPSLQRILQSPTIFYINITKQTPIYKPGTHFIFRSSSSWLADTNVQGKEEFAWDQPTRARTGKPTRSRREAPHLLSRRRHWNIKLQPKRLIILPPKPQLQPQNILQQSHIAACYLAPVLEGGGNLGCCLSCCSKAVSGSLISTTIQIRTHFGTHLSSSLPHPLVLIIY